MPWDMWNGMVSCGITYTRTSFHFLFIPLESDVDILVASSLFEMSWWDFFEAFAKISVSWYWADTWVIFGKSILKDSSLVFLKDLKNPCLATQPWWFGQWKSSFLRIFRSNPSPTGFGNPRYWGFMHRYLFFLLIRIGIGVISSSTQILSEESLSEELSHLWIPHLLPNVPVVDA